MRPFHSFLMSLPIAAGLILSSALAHAEPTISMNGPGWTKSKTFHGLEFICAEEVCGGEAAVFFQSTRVLANTEEELNKPYTNVRAVVNEAILYMFDGQTGGWKLTEISKSAKEDYTAIHAAGTINGEAIAVMFIYQGGRAYTIGSVAESVNAAKANLAKAFKSGDFRRPPQ